MTLVLSVTGPEFVVQLSDRLLTPLSRANGRATPDTNADEVNKAGVLRCGDARLGYSYCGLARAGEFDTRRWLIKALLECAPPDCQIEHLVERLASMATKTFAENSDILSRPRADRRLSIMLAGYWNTTAGVLPAGWILTNFQRNFDLGSGAPDLPESEPEFRFWRWHQTPGSSSPFYHIERLGAWNGVDAVQAARLEDLLRDQKPVDAVIGRALKVMHTASDAVTTGSVGKQVSVVVIPKDWEVAIRFAYETNVPTDDLPVPDIVVAEGPRRCRWMTLDITHTATPDSPSPASVPRVHRKAPCPCGARQRYETCHRRFRRDIPRSWRVTTCVADKEET